MEGLGLRKMPSERGSVCYNPWHPWHIRFWNRRGLLLQRA